MTNLKVAVRVRPMSDRELATGAQYSVSIDDGVISITNIKVPKHHAGDSRERIRKFAFDYCYDQDASQERIFSMIEKEVSTALLNKYNSCVLAYGQSSTGKTYTMLGTQDDPGLTPKLCQNIFSYLGCKENEDQKYFNMYVSYLEIYNERVCDLLIHGSNGKSLKVREHPKRGPYVQGLSEHQVQSPDELISWLKIGNGNRRVAATSNNRRSSRSHSVFTITLGSIQARGTSVKLHLVDLAGSEKANAAHRELNTPRLKEGANINRSLVALGNVICALSDTPARYGRSYRKRFVPYRDSILTWLLKETLGGNSKTVMIATISPSSSCYSETVNTLRFGQRATQIVNQPIVNEDVQEKLIRELRAEIFRLKELLKIQNIVDVPSNKDELSSDYMMSKSDPPSSECTTPQPEVAAQVRTETLIPVIDFTSRVEPKPAKTIRLNRTSSAEFPKPIVTKLGKEFGSHEVLSKSVSPNTKGTRGSTTNLSERSSTSRSGSVSECSEISIPKSTQRINNTRTEKVASVTKRLFGQANKRELSNLSDRSTKSDMSKDVMSAKIRLQEISQKALRANRRKVHADTQTDEPSILRYKEKGTDMQDMKIVVDEMKHVAVGAVIETACVGVSCQVQNYSQSIKLTATCSTQTDEEQKIPTQSVSFTKYLQDVPLEIQAFAQPIYTSSVNINVSHNYPNNSKEEISDDSLEGNAKQTQFSKPDLISNHNSFEGNLNGLTETNASNEKPLTKIASMSLPQQAYACEHFDLAARKVCVAARCATPVRETAHCSSQPLVYASETRLNDLFTEKCSTFIEKNVYSRTLPTCDNKPKPCAIHHKPFILKPCIKSSDDTSTDSETDISYCSHKKVHFHKRKDMKYVIANFLDEASDLLINLNAVAKQVEKREKSHSVHCRHKLKEPVGRKKDRSVQTRVCSHDMSSQTHLLDAPSRYWSQPSSSRSFREEEFPENKWERIVQESCDKLESYLKRTEPKPSKNETDVFESNLGPVPLLSSHPEWRYGTDYSSLDTAQSASDYGSLPRKDVKSQRSAHKQYSPKAYMKQLVEMRKKIIENSRNDLISE